MTARVEVQRLRSRLDAVFERAPDPMTDLELQADFAKYLCVLVSAYLECALRALLLDFVRSRSSGKVESFVGYKLKPWTNPKTNKIIDLFGLFDKDWRADLAAFLIDEKKDSVDSLVALRNRIAHGENVEVTLSRIKKIYQVVNEVITHVADLMVS